MAETTTAKPYLWADADRLMWRTESTGGKIVMPHEPFLTWLRSENIDPARAKRCEVYEARDGKPPYAIVTLYELDENGRRVLDEVREECVTYTEIVPLSSLPPLTEV
ncbi:hypothetical protein ACIBK9_47205 [Nonomuraea sp. NPDC050227]|uniref:hypothetical protein n=1 Tax=Nonomuraea sp. NPDC050227 TaxID=3364360 RepID=UPI00379F5E69